MLTKKLFRSNILSFFLILISGQFINSMHPVLRNYLEVKLDLLNQSPVKVNEFIKILDDYLILKVKKPLIVFENQEEIKAIYKYLKLYIEADKSLEAEEKEDLEELIACLDKFSLDKRFYGHLSHINRIIKSADNKYIATISEDTTARIWHVATKTNLLLLGHNGPIVAISLSPNNQKVLTFDTDNILIYWNLQNGKIISNKICNSNFIVCNLEFLNNDYFCIRWSNNMLGYYSVKNDVLKLLI